ncbi:hypothetical protein FOL47_007195 [Perkinsus chesapeaki]|uniref:RRM domain-containing protein n=1 Tax=Perkinsus chesapeaki TaxID=330153 RepID=A0A7J6LN77_PERCH|nr:hypothetical protein FOL47_007195 [Perkinsus chesapeaki]
MATPRNDYTPPTPELATSRLSKGSQPYYSTTGTSTAANTPEMSSTSSRVTPLAAAAGGVGNGMMGNIATTAAAPGISSIPEFGTTVGGVGGGSGKQLQPQDLSVLAQQAAGMQSFMVGMRDYAHADHMGRPMMSNGSSALNPNVTERKLFIGGLPSLVDRQTLWNYFSQFGQLEEAVVMMDKLTGRSRGFGFITFVNVKDLESCLSYPNAHVLLDKTVDVKRAISQEEIRAQTALQAQPSSGLTGGPGGSGLGMMHHMIAGTTAPAQSSMGGFGGLGAGGVTSSGLPPQENPCKVFCGGLPATVDRERLRQHFSRYGVITDCIVKVDRTSGRSRGFGYVTFQTPAEAQAAIQGGVDGQGNTIDGKWVEVKPSTREGTGPSKYLQGGIARYPTGGSARDAGWAMAGATAAAAPPPHHYMASPQPPHYVAGYGMQQQQQQTPHHQPSNAGYGSGSGNGATPNTYSSGSPQQNNGYGGVMSPAHGYHHMFQQQQQHQQRAAAVYHHHQQNPAPQLYTPQAGGFSGADSMPGGHNSSDLNSSGADGCSNSSPLH